MLVQHCLFQSKESDDIVKYFIDKLTTVSTTSFKGTFTRKLISAKIKGAKLILKAISIKLRDALKKSFTTKQYLCMTDILVLHIKRESMHLYVKCYKTLHQMHKILKKSN